MHFKNNSQEQQWDLVGLSGISSSFNATEIFALLSARLTDIKISEPEHTPHPFYSLPLPLPTPQLTVSLYFSSLHCVFTSCVITINNQQDRTCVVHTHATPWLCCEQPLQVLAT